MSFKSAPVKTFSCYFLWANRNKINDTREQNNVVKHG